MDDRRMRGAAGVVVMIGGGIAFFACDGRSLTAPLPTASLTVRVLTRVHETPIVGAKVIVFSLGVFFTDVAGQASVSVPKGQEISVDVRADGFAGFGADGAIANAETWTFYLERASEGQP